MRYRLFFVLFSVLISLIAYGQDGQNSVITSDEVGNSYDFSILYKSTNVRVNKKVCYYWYRNGLLKSNTGNYTANLLHGKFEKFDCRGNLCEKGNFKYGTKDGIWSYWEANGKIQKEEQWKSGFLTLRRSFKNDTIVEEPYRNNVLHGKKSAMVDGHVILSQRYKDGRLILIKKKGHSFLPKFIKKIKKKKVIKQPVDAAAKK